jgi:hypothetical protein
MLSSDTSESIYKRSRMTWLELITRMTRVNKKNYSSYKNNDCTQLNGNTSSPTTWLERAIFSARTNQTDGPSWAAHHSHVRTAAYNTIGEERSSKMEQI